MIIDPPSRERLVVFLVAKGFPWSEMILLDRMELLGLAKLVQDVEKRGLDPDGEAIP
jgi:hypothetical protein